MRILLRSLLLVFVLSLLAVVGGFGCVVHHQELLLAEAEAYIRDHYGFNIELGTVSISSYSALPQLQVRLREVYLSHADDHASHIQIDTVDVGLYITDYWQGDLRLDQVLLRGGAIRLEANSSLLENIRESADQDEGIPNTIGPSLSLNADLLFTAEELSILYRDTIRDKRMQATINCLQADIEREAAVLTGQLDVDLAVQQLTFNPAKGSYLEDTRIRMQPKMDYESGCLTLPDFDLWIAREHFHACASLEMSNGGSFELDLKNEATPFATTITHVPETLRKKLSRYNLAEPLATRIRVSGGFGVGDNPLARIDFYTTNNQFRLKNYPPFEQVTARGYFINRVAKDDTNWDQEHPLNLRLYFKELSANYAGVRMAFPRLEVSSTPQVLVHLEGGMVAKGEVDALNPFLPDNEWEFHEGHFCLVTDFSGPVTDEIDLLRSLNTTTLALSQVEVQKNERAGTVRAVTLAQVRLALVGDSLQLEEGLIDLPGNSQLALQGYWLGNWPWYNGQSEYRIEPESYLSCQSAFLRASDLNRSLALFRTEQSTGLGIPAMLQWAKRTFNPRMEWQIDSLELEQDLVRDITLKTRLEGTSALQLEWLAGTIGTNTVDCSGTIDFAPVVPEWNIAVSTRGSARWFNRLFDNNTFFFEKGAYRFTGSVNGPIEDWADIQTCTQGKLALWDGAVLLGPTAVKLPLEELRVDYRGDDLQLDMLRLPLHNGRGIELSGEVRHFRDLLSSGVDATNVNSSIYLKASRLEFEDLQTVFSSAQQLAEGQPTAAKPQAFKPSLRAIYQKFHPCLELEIDTFQLQHFTSTGNCAQISFRDENQMVFNNTGFKFKGNPVQLSAVVAIDHPTETPFEVTVETERFDLAALVEAYDYFGLTSLQRAEKVAGKVSLRADLQGKVVDSEGFQKDRLLGRVHFNLHEAELVNFAPIQEVANKFFRTERLHTIRFAPITDTLHITHRVVHIPRMEIQSTAFNLFVEGHLNYDNNTNIWVSLPWKNLKSWQEGELPAKTGYAEAGGKLFVEIQDREGQMQYRLRLTNKRLYRHRGIPDQYRIDKREERATRRAWRKKKREAKRTGA